ncbi:hypothetical protein [Nocardia coubleae]|uniref:Uncharacterized protein n=1 Tax=Nocardia coubleae TaxID=356147 RepID=A0A846W9T4_9NOCA|nr:hypothetical protein [Nocardia coubleae]NKX89158.1 hypothetical protein [Nocardia coubleae]
MSEFRVTGVYPVSFRPTPFVTGYASGNFAMGDTVELRRASNPIAHGVLQGMHIHLSPRGEHSFFFSGDISEHVRVDDVIHTIDTTTFLLATHGGADLIASAVDAAAGGVDYHDLIDE